jgi:uncharacterized protein
MQARADTGAGASRGRTSRGLVLVTGASAGVGAELARAFAARKFDLVLLARRKDKLEQLAHELSHICGVHAIVLPADLSLPEAPQKVFAEIGRKGLHVDILVNNAGVICEGDFVDVSLGDELRLLQTNVVAPTALTRLFAAAMKQRGAGRILNVASIAGFMPAPRIAIYAAAKAYVLSFSEAIAEELRNSGVTVTALCPGFTDTPMLRASGFGRALPFPLVTSAKAVAEQGVAACLAGRTICVPGLVNLATVSGAQVLPRAWVRTLGGLARRFVPIVAGSEAAEPKSIEPKSIEPASRTGARGRGKTKKQTSGSER